jgi:tight adherence protein B
MSALLIALGAALAAGLLIPGAALATRSWARTLHQSRERTLEARFSDAFVFIESRRYAWLLALLVVACSGLTTLLSANGLLGCAAGALTLCMPALAARWLQRRRRQRAIAQLPDALDLLASSLRSGLALAPALRHLAEHQPAPLSQELVLVIRRQRLGRSLEEALDIMHSRIGGAEMALFTTAVAVARVVGGNLSEVLARLAQTLRDRQSIERKITALTAQARLQARIAGLLPVALLMVMWRLEPRAMHLMFSTTQGWAALLTLAVLEAAGAFWLSRQARIDV